jgi:hypothetical protein
LKLKLAVLICAFASMAMAQLSNYLGPGILTRGAGDIGTRSGEQVDLRFYADVSGVYDNGVQPIALDSKGNLIQVNGLYGVEANIGAYGVHRWKQAQLGLDYKGNFRHYTQQSFYDGSDHQFTLGYTYQKSRRLYYDVRAVAGTYSRSIGGIPGVTTSAPASVVDQPTALLFDNRTDFAEGEASLTYLLSSRTSVSLGGQGFLMDRRSKLLIGMNGYGAHASIQHRLSKVTSIGAVYERLHFQFPHLFGQSDTNSYQAFVATQFGRHWTFSMRVGAFQSEVAGLEQVALDPNIAALFGVSTVIQTFYRNQWFPSATVSLSRQFHHSNLSFNYDRYIAPGNGVYLTSRSENASATYSYTGIRKVSLMLTGGEFSLSSVGQGLVPYRQIGGGAGFTYALTRAIHLTSRYDERHQDLNFGGYRPTSSRVTFGLAFSPGKVPLSLW